MSLFTICTIITVLDILYALSMNLSFRVRNHPPLVSPGNPSFSRVSSVGKSSSNVSFARVSSGGKSSSNVSFARVSSAGAISVCCEEFLDFLCHIAAMRTCHPRVSSPVRSRVAIVLVVRCGILLQTSSSASVVAGSGPISGSIVLVVRCGILLLTSSSASVVAGSGPISGSSFSDTPCRSGSICFGIPWLSGGIPFLSWCSFEISLLAFWYSVLFVVLVRPFSLGFLWTEYLCLFWY